MEEKKLIQELYYILYYAKIADGAVVMTNYFNQIEKKILSMRVDIAELSPMQRRVFKRFGSFILRGGIIDTEIAFNDYQKNITVFYDIFIEFDLKNSEGLTRSKLLKIVTDLKTSLNKAKRYTRN
jgi:hypothetical protein